LQYTLSMRAVQNLEEIRRTQVVLADRIGIGARLGACGLVLLLCLVTGQSTPSIVAASFFFGLGIFCLFQGVRIAQKKDPSPLFVPSLVLDCLAVAVNGFVVVRFFGFVSALPMLIVLEGYCSAVSLLSALRLSTREVIWAGSAAVVAPGVVSLGAFILQPDSGVRALFLVPVLNVLIAIFSGVFASQSRNALKDNLVTEDLLRASRRLKMTMDIVAASIFNLHQLVNKLGEVSTTVSSGVRNQGRHRQGHHRG